MTDMKTTADKLYQRLQCYVEPLVLLCYFFAYLPLTLVFDPVTLFTSPSTFQREWFARVWKVIGAPLSSDPVQTQEISALISPNTHGVVLELGPGGGDQMHHFTPLLKADRITHVYAAEPNEFLHAKLRDAARTAGFKDDQYTILTAGGEPDSLLPAIQAAGLLTRDNRVPDGGIFDTVISIKVLCSFSRQSLEETLTVLQALLKPGGKFVFYDHMGNKTDRVSRIYAWCLMWIWPIVVGGCRLDCQFEDVVKEMAVGWKEKRIKEAEGVEEWSVFRFVDGWLTKA